MTHHPTPRAIRLSPGANGKEGSCNKEEKLDSREQGQPWLVTRTVLIMRIPDIPGIGYSMRLRYSRLNVSDFREESGASREFNNALNIEFRGEGYSLSKRKKKSFL